MVTAFGQATHVGRERKYNEDSFLADQGLGLWIVADGMGGHECGEVASQIVVDFVYDHVGQGLSVREAIERAHQIVLIAADQGLGLPGMGSTVVALKLNGSEYEVFWVGDSRAYLWDQGHLRQLTRDHSLVQYLVDAGEITSVEAINHPHRNVVTQALGAADLEAVQPERVCGTLYQGQQILLCSDGLTSEVSDAEIRNVLQGAGNEQSKVDRLIERALENGGSDNITVLLVAAPADAPAKPREDPTIPLDAEDIA